MGTKNEKAGNGNNFKLAINLIYHDKKERLKQANNRWHSFVFGMSGFYNFFYYQQFFKYMTNALQLIQID